jgi:hypothetical protein
MIFFLVMPALIGGFGNIKITVKLDYCELKNKILLIKSSFIKICSVRMNDYSSQTLSKESFNQFGHYLAGLIEGDGTIIVPIKDKSEKGKKYHPIIRIVFHTKDLKLAELLREKLNIGYIQRSKGNYILWEIQDIQGLIKIVNLINGKMRTPKIEALHRLINWLNKRIDNEFILKTEGLDISTINSNSWLAGFSDADSNFSVTTSKRKNGKVRVQGFYRIEVKQIYSKEVSEELGGNSFFYIMSKISSYLGVNLLSRTRSINDKIYYSFILIAYSPKSQDLIRSYFNNFSIFSSKYLEYLNWCEILDLVKEEKHKSKEGLLICENIKNNMNTKRTNYNWKHLSKFYI